MTKRGKLENGGIAKLLEELDTPGFSGLVHFDCSKGDAHVRIRAGRVIAARVHWDFAHNPFGRRSREGAGAIREIATWHDVEYCCEETVSARDPFDPRDGRDIRDLAATA
jgi:hypothetical protein